MTGEHLAELKRQGWRLTRDGSTATAHFAWDDPDDPESGWELLVLHTAGHGSRFTLNTVGLGLSERPAAEARRLSEALAGALTLLDGWRGELPDEEDA